MASSDDHTGALGGDMPGVDDRKTGIQRGDRLVMADITGDQRVCELRGLRDQVRPRSGHHRDLVHRL